MVFRIREARETAGLTQSQLADLLGINNVTLSGYETGKHDPKSETLVKIAKVCNTTTDFLLGREPYKPELADEHKSCNDDSAIVLRKQLHDYIDSLTDEEIRAMCIVLKLQKSNP